MVRSLPALVLLVGCLPPSSEEGPPAAIDVDWRGVLTADTNGFALRDDGQGGQAAMMSTTCTFAADGGVTGDEDPSDDEEVVTDGGNDQGQDDGGGGGGFVTLAITSDHLYVFEDSGKPDRGLAVRDIRGAVLVDGGVAFTENDTACNLHVAGVNYDERLVIGLPDWACEGAVAGSRDEDAVVISGPDETIVVRPEGTIQVEGRGSLVAWDDFTGLVYTAQRGEPLVRASSIDDGSLRWEVDLGDAVHSIDDLGARAAVAVIVKTADGGALRILDGATGALLVDEATPSEGEIVGARDGDALGVAVADEVHLFDLR